MFHFAWVVLQRTLVFLIPRDIWSLNFNFFPLITCKASRYYSRLNKDYLITKSQLLQPSPFSCNAGKWRKQNGRVRNRHERNQLGVACRVKNISQPYCHMT